MLLLYRIGIAFYIGLAKIAACFNRKAKLWKNGQQDLLRKIATQIDASQKHIWFHFASLGEFEQGRPVLEKLKELHPNCKLVITFFSPSGYEIRRNYPLADYVFYLPIDTRFNAKTFIKIINPEIVVFTKYEYWYYYFKELNQRKISLYIISGIFRPNHIFFKWYGLLHRRMLTFVSHFFVQNQESKSLLANFGINNVTVTGDTRFDRVAANAHHPKSFDQVKTFCGDAKIFIAGSTWPADEKLLAELIKKYPKWKFIIAPHEINKEKLNHLLQLLPVEKTIRFSQLTKYNSLHATVLIIDNIGMLSSIYQYANVAYVGGGFSAGIHNILEPAAFGLPIIFGPKYQKFQEAKDLITLKAAFSIKNSIQLFKVMEQLQQEDFLLQCKNTSSNYVKNHVGATAKIINYITQNFSC